MEYFDVKSGIVSCECILGNNSIYMFNEPINVYDNDKEYDYCINSTKEHIKYKFEKQVHIDDPLAKLNYEFQIIESIHAKVPNRVEIICDEIVHEYEPYESNYIQINGCKHNIEFNDENINKDNNIELNEIFKLYQGKKIKITIDIINEVENEK